MREFLTRNGWFSDPAGYHRTPPRLRAVSLIPRQTRHLGRRVGYAELSFESEYEPHPGEPARERWLAQDDNGTAVAYVLEHPNADRPWLVCTHGFGMGQPERQPDGPDGPLDPRGSGPERPDARAAAPRPALGDAHERRRAAAARVRERAPSVLAGGLGHPAHGRLDPLPLRCAGRPLRRLARGLCGLPRFRVHRRPRLRHRRDSRGRLRLARPGQRALGLQGLRRRSADRLVAREPRDVPGLAADLRAAPVRSRSASSTRASRIGSPARTRRVRSGGIGVGRRSSGSRRAT